MKKAIMEQVMQSIRSSVVTQMRNEHWARRLAEMPEGAGTLDSKLLDALADDIARNATAALVDVCGACGTVSDGDAVCAECGEDVW